MNTDLSFSYRETAGITPSRLSVSFKTLDVYARELAGIVKKGGYDDPEASLNLVSDDAYYGEIMAMRDRFASDRLRYLIVVGIGGSNLGTQAVYDAVRGTLDAYAEKQPKILFADTTSEKLIVQMRGILERLADADEVLMNVISKSGTTTETIANFEVLFALFRERFGDEAASRVVVTTDHDSALWQRAQEQGLPTLSIPNMVGGRYSVFSAVGMFPLALAGVDTDALREGARAARDNALTEEENLARISAALLFAHYKKGITINNNFFFDPELESIGKWYRQLMGESIGKQYTQRGKEAHIGITPIVSVGSTDLHSMAQLYFGGPKDKFTTFVYAGGARRTVVPRGTFSDLVSGIEGRSLRDIMDAIYEGVKRTYRSNKLPFIEVTLPFVDERSVGAYMQYKMTEIMYLAKLLKVNAFDQPNVEEYKDETRSILQQGT